MSRIAAIVVGLGLLTSASVNARETLPRDVGATYLFGEAKRIGQESKRIAAEARRMRSEAQRLNREADSLRDGASRLDKKWQAAKTANPEIAEYEGRDKSQQRMRLDATREDADADALRNEGKRLDDESERLYQLQAAVNSEAQKQLIDRFRGCCRTSDLKIFRKRVVQLARSIGARYSPVMVR